MSELKICPEIKYRVPTPYTKTMGSGWFWCHLPNAIPSWIVCYVNALWGARVDGHYISMGNFDDVEGPLAEPSDRSPCPGNQGG